MRSLRIPRPNPALAVSFLALLVALGGTTYAAITLPKNSVGGKQLKPGAVTSPKVRDGSLLAKDFKAGQLPGSGSGAGGEKGGPGAKGDRGDPGPAGPTEGFATATASGSFIDSTPDAIVSQATFSLAHEGRLYVQARGIAAVTCSPPATVVDAGLYVDGGSATEFAATAAGSGQELATGNTVQVSFSTFGVTPVLSAGEHKVSYRTNCLTGSASMVSGSGSDGAIAAILLGS
ncbi:MAG TPA: hypothetical protein VH476_08750 [Solirubrobacterales bacterium]|jgi:hypothetical protein